MKPGGGGVVNLCVSAAMCAKPGSLDQGPQAYLLEVSEPAGVGPRERL
jgi:hypothetical protein